MSKRKENFASKVLLHIGLLESEQCVMSKRPKTEPHLSPADQRGILWDRVRDGWSKTYAQSGSIVRRYDGELAVSFQEVVHRLDQSADGWHGL